MPGCGTKRQGGGEPMVPQAAWVLIIVGSAMVIVATVLRLMLCA